MMNGVGGLKSQLVAAVMLQLLLRCCCCCFDVAVGKLLLLLTHFRVPPRQTHCIAKWLSSAARRFPIASSSFWPPSPNGPSIVVAGKVKTMANNFYNVRGCKAEEKWQWSKQLKIRFTRLAESDTQKGKHCPWLKVLMCRGSTANIGWARHTFITLFIGER